MTIRHFRRRFANWSICWRIPTTGIRTWSMSTHSCTDSGARVTPGHSRTNPFPDAVTAENTFVNMFQHQLERWKKTPMATNTQPDFSKVGNSELLDRTVRSCNWLRTDTIFIENEQIEELSNRPPWTGVTVEVGMSDGSAKSLKLDEGMTYTDNVVQHVHDVGACYFSLWNWHHIQADRILNYYQQYPDAIDGLARQIGYRVRPSWVWTYEEGGYPGLIIGFVNDGIAAVPGVLAGVGCERRRESKR